MTEEEHPGDGDDVLDADHEGHVPKKPAHDRSAERGQMPPGPGASGVGEPGYDGGAALNTAGGDAHPLSYEEPFGRGTPSGPPPQLREDEQDEGERPA